MAALMASRGPLTVHIMPELTTAMGITRRHIAHTTDTTTGITIGITLTGITTTIGTTTIGTIGTTTTGIITGSIEVIGHRPNGPGAGKVFATIT